MAFLTNLLLLVCAIIRLSLANPVPNPVAVPAPNPIGPIQPACTTSVHIDAQAADWPGTIRGVGGTCTAGTAGQPNPESLSLLALLTHYQAVPFRWPKATHMESHGESVHLWA